MNKTFDNCTLLDTKTWFEKARPNPTLQDVQAQLGVHCEEVSEMLNALGSDDSRLDTLLYIAKASMQDLANHLKGTSGHPRIQVLNPDEMLDGLCDQIVTATGVAHTLGYNIVAAMTEVNRSNFSKFDEQGNPIYNENKKVMKGPNYSAPDLTPYLPK